jgi:hypothetical protein
MASKLNIELGLVDNMSAGLARMQGILEKFSRDVSQNMGNVGGSFGKTFGAMFTADAAMRGLTAAWGALKGAVTDGLESYDKQIMAEASLRESLGYTSKALLEQADALMKLTRFDDQETIAAAARLSLYIKDEEAIKRLIPLVQDFATAKGMDLVSASEAVGKTIGTTTNTLGRYGVQISDSKSRTERLSEVTEKLKAGFEGQARAMAEIGMGPLVLFKNQWGEVEEKLAGAVLPLLNDMVKALNNMLPAINNAVEGLSALFRMKSNVLGAEKNLAAGAEISALGDAYKQMTANRVWAEGQLQAAKKRGSEADTEYYGIRLQEAKNEETLALRAVQAWRQAHGEYGGGAQESKPKPKSLPDFVGAKAPSAKEDAGNGVWGPSTQLAAAGYTDQGQQLAYQKQVLDQRLAMFSGFSVQMVSVEEQLVLNLQTIWGGFSSSIEDRLKGVFDTMTDLNMSWSEKWSAILNRAYTAAMDLVWKLLTARIKGMIAERAISKASAASVAADNVTQAVSGAGALAIDSAKSVAKYPYVGAILALAAGAAAAAWAATQISKSKSYQMGTSFHPGGLARLHQNEVVDLPRGTRVYNSAEAGQISNSTSNVSSTINVSAGRLSVRDLVSALGEAQRSGQLRGFQRDFTLGMAR